MRAASGVHGLPLKPPLKAGLYLVPVWGPLEDVAQLLADHPDVAEGRQCDAALDDVVAKAVLQHVQKLLLVEVVHFANQLVLGLLSQVEEALLNNI